MMTLLFSQQFIIFAKNSIIDGRLDFKEAPENIENFKTKTRWIKRS